MRGFADAEGCIYAYRKDAPEAPTYHKPESVAFENRYYAFKREDGGWDHNSFEDAFNRVEKHWKGVVEALEARDPVGGLTYWLIFGFMTAMRARGPAARNFTAGLKAVELRADVKALKSRGRLPGGLKRFENELDTVPVGINPAMSLSAMTGDMRSIAELSRRIGFEILHNQTGRPFITSDNPVAYFDPSVAEGRMAPYAEAEAVELLFPISRR